MQKLKLIIPKTLSHFSLKSLIIVSLTILASKICRADKYGCWIPGTNNIWHTNDPAHPGPINFLNDGVTGALNGVDDGYYDLDGRCGATTDVCYVYWQASTPWHPAGDLRGVGYLNDYSYTACPIDDYMPLLFIFTAGFSFFKMRRRSVHLNENNLNHSCI
ncbi:hypothetical protein [Pedobacter paludis]|uniref:Uncharacterized protein n=1 Tax=Pedobacter paludis TaxID=2203212 RepID=A0A317EXV9_9SPHI|nr:hypothetical protein [Pedobacter paludis]PWS31661.1 hypothetical protein DF947_13835 [Pedobacter paludis]